MLGRSTRWQVSTSHRTLRARSWAVLKGPETDYTLLLDRIGILTADAGCVLEILDNEIAKDGYMMPLDLGAKGS